MHSCELLGSAWRSWITVRRLLAESWRAMRAPVQDAIKAAPHRSPAAAPPAAAASASARRLEELLASRGAPSEAWREYRSLLAFYGRHGTFGDANRMPQGSAAGTPHSARLTPRVGQQGQLSSRLGTPRAVVSASAAEGGGSAAPTGSSGRAAAVSAGAISGGGSDGHGGASSGGSPRWQQQQQEQQQLQRGNGSSGSSSQPAGQGSPEPRPPSAPQLRGASAVPRLPLVAAAAGRAASASGGGSPRPGADGANSPRH